MANLKDLCSQDKQKVSNIIKQVVELKQDRLSLQQLLQQAVDAQGVTKEKLAGLTQSNKDLVRENANLKAKLVNAVTLLRIYQHKVHVLEASLAHVHNGYQESAPPTGLQAAQPAFAASGSVAPACPSAAHTPLALLPAQPTESAQAAAAAPLSAKRAGATAVTRELPQHASREPHDASQAQPQAHQHPQSHQPHQPQALQDQQPHQPQSQDQQHQPPQLSQPQPQHAQHQQPQLPQPQHQQPQQEQEHHHQHHHPPQKQQQQAQQPGAPGAVPKPRLSVPGAGISASCAANRSPAAAMQASTPTGSATASLHKSSDLAAATSHCTPGLPVSPAGDGAASERSFLTTSPGESVSLLSHSPGTQPPSPAPAVHTHRPPSPAPGVHSHWPPGGAALANSTGHAAGTQPELLALAQVIGDLAKSVQLVAARETPQPQQRQRQRLLSNAASGASVAMADSSASGAQQEPSGSTSSSSQGSVPDRAAGHAYLSWHANGQHASQDDASGVDQSKNRAARKLQLEGHNSITFHRLSNFHSDPVVQSPGSNWEHMDAPDGAHNNPVDTLAELICEMEQVGQEPWHHLSSNGLLTKQMGPAFWDIDNMGLVEENDVLAIIAAQEGAFSFN